MKPMLESVKFSVLVPAPLLPRPSRLLKELCQKDFPKVLPLFLFLIFVTVSVPHRKNFPLPYRFLPRARTVPHQNWHRGPFIIKYREPRRTIQNKDRYLSSYMVNGQNFCKMQ